MRKGIKLLCRFATQPGKALRHLIRFALQTTFPSGGRLIYLPVAQPDSASDSAFRHRRNIARRGDGTLGRTAPCDYHSLYPERQTLKVFRKNNSSNRTTCCSCPLPLGGEGLYIYLWHSRIARQTPTLKVRGSNPRGQAKKTPKRVFFLAPRFDRREV